MNAFSYLPLKIKHFPRFSKSSALPWLNCSSSGKLAWGAELLALNSPKERIFLRGGAPSG